MIDKCTRENLIPIFLYPGTVFVSSRNHQIFTVLGSCISICLWDKELKVGGINHFLLPNKNDGTETSPKYGDFATQLLIAKMLALGCRKENLWAKVFGGATQFDKKGNNYNVGQSNVKLAFETLKRENIMVISSHTGGDRGRKLRFNVRTGEVIMMVL